MHANLAMRQHIAAPARLSAGRRGARILSRSSAVQPRASALQASELQAIGKALQEARSLPPSQRQEALQSAGRVVKEKLNSMRAGDETMLWRSFEGRTKRRTVFPGDLKLGGIKNPELIAKSSLQDRDSVFNFMAAVTVSTSLAAVVIGNVLPGQWGYFGSYLVGGISLAVLAIGSVNPGILQWGLDKFARIDAKYRERILAHEAAHFLVAYALGVPVTSYSVDIGTEHIEMVDAALERSLFAKKFEDSELDTLSVVAMSGVAAEALRFEDVRGQGADLMDLQRMLNRSASPLSANDQQNLTRWAVWQAANIIKANKAAHEALMQAMEQGKPVEECIQILEAANKKSPSS